MNKQMITRTTDRRALGAREISLFCHLLFSQTLSLRKKTRESGERAERERERDFFEKKCTSCVQQQTTQRGELFAGNARRGPTDGEQKKHKKRAFHTLFSLFSSTRTKNTRGAHWRDPGVFLCVRLRDKEKGRGREKR